MKEQYYVYYALQDSIQFEIRQMFFIVITFIPLFHK